jgi:hypothetical protein
MAPQLDGPECYGAMSIFEIVIDENHRCGIVDVKVAGFRRLAREAQAGADEGEMSLKRAEVSDPYFSTFEQPRLCAAEMRNAFKSRRR